MRTAAQEQRSIEQPSDAHAPLPTAAPSPIATATALLDHAAEAGVPVRALGGVAVAMRCPSALAPPLRRDLHDIDLVTTRSAARDLARCLAEAGCVANDRFNALHGRSRMIFATADETHLDVLVGELAMCHRLDLEPRLTIDERTIGLADLLLTKLQIAELNAKDAGDLTALLLDHALTDDASGIDAGYVADLLARDWGWWRTTTHNLELLDRLVPAMGLGDARAALVRCRIGALRERIDGTRKSFGWRSRAKLGERVAWRADPEEVGTG